jgi:type I restriction enzyme S subunit
VRPDASKIVSRFLFLILWQWHFQNRTLEFQAQTTGIRNLRTPDYLAQEIYLPPLHEQERIVDLISSVDSYIEALEQQAESARKSRSAVLHEMLSAGGEGWTETTLGEVAECSWGNTETTKSKYVDAGYLAYSASGADGFLDWFEHDRTAVVLSAIGAQCGKTWFADGKWTSIKNTIWLKSDNLNLLDKYLFYLSNGEQFWQIRGQAQPFISLGDVKKTKVNLPPLPEQKRIVDLISSMDNGISATEKLISDTKQLRSGLLSDLLSGEHEIPQSYDKVMGAA